MMLLDRLIAAFAESVDQRSFDRAEEWAEAAFGLARKLQPQEEERP